jgi:hypothetical protein
MKLWLETPFEVLTRLLQLARFAAMLIYVKRALTARGWCSHVSLSLQLTFTGYTTTLQRQGRGL